MAVEAMPRRPAPLGGRKPTRADLPAFSGAPAGVDDVLPADFDVPRGPQDPPCGVRLLIVGINPGLWTAAVNAPFARPGNRFWPSLEKAGLTGHVDVSCGMSAGQVQDFLSRGLGLTNLVARATARADELGRDELRAGARRLVERVANARPGVVAVAGITAYRDAFGDRHARIGRQDPAGVPGWPAGTALWVVPQPSGLNAHYQVDDLARIWRQVWA